MVLQNIPKIRFAELEIKLAAFKLLKRFNVEWVPDYKIDLVWKLSNYPDKPLVFRFVDRR